MSHKMSSVRLGSFLGGSRRSVPTPARAKKERDTDAVDVGSAVVALPASVTPVVIVVLIIIWVAMTPSACAQNFKNACDCVSVSPSRKLRASVCHRYLRKGVVALALRCQWCPR